MSPQQALAAQELMPITKQGITEPETPSVKTRFPNQLTRRETEVLRLVAEGLTDAQIAQQLVISPRTVNWHLTAIYSKLGVSSRSAATRYTLDHALG